MCVCLHACIYLFKLYLCKNKGGKAHKSSLHVGIYMYMCRCNSFVCVLCLFVCVCVLEEEGVGEVQYISYLSCLFFSFLHLQLVRLIEGNLSALCKGWLDALVSGSIVSREEADRHAALAPALFKTACAFILSGVRKRVDTGC